MFRIVSASERVCRLLYNIHETVIKPIKDMIVAAGFIGYFLSLKEHLQIKRATTKDTNELKILAQETHNIV